MCSGRCRQNGNMKRRSRNGLASHGSLNCRCPCRLCRPNRTRPPSEAAKIKEPRTWAGRPRLLAFPVQPQHFNKVAIYERLCRIPHNDCDNDAPSASFLARRNNKLSNNAIPCIRVHETNPATMNRSVSRGSDRLLACCVSSIQAYAISSSRAFAVRVAELTRIDKGIIRVYCS